MRDPVPHPGGPHRRLDLVPSVATDDGVEMRGALGPAALPGIAPDVVFTFSYVSWQAAAKRGWYMPEDRLAKALVSHERVGRLLVSDMMRSLPVKLVRDVLSRNSVEHEPFPTDESTRLISPVRLRRNYPTSIAAVQRACAAYDRALERHVRQMGLRQPVVITTNPLMAGFAKFAWAGPVTFFAHDDWLAYPLHERWWPAYEESFARVRERGRRVVSISTAALERIAPTGPSLVVPNGLDPREWSGPATAPPAWTADGRRPLVLYVGSLDSRIDIQAMLGLARDLPEATIALVGPLLDGEHLAPLGDVANIEIHEPLGREGVTALIRCADVGLVPHVSSDLTRAMSPLKLYEYLAGGLPVVAADLPPVRGVSDSVTLVEPGGDYAPAVRAALALGRGSEADRQTFIASNSWHARQEALLDLAFA